MSALVRYWVDAAREQNRWRVKLRAAARAERNVRKFGRLYDAARRCADRRDVFMVQARRIAAQLDALRAGQHRANERE